MNTKWINIFRTGTHTDSAGHTKTWTDSDLDRIVSNFARRTEDPPLVFGHPTSSDPAQGWFAALRKRGEFLQAQFAQPTDTARRALDNGDYKYGSLSLTPDLRIRHFGLLGAVPPAVKGLGRVEFGEADGGLTVDVQINHTDPAHSGEEEHMDPKELQAQLDALKTKLAELEALAKEERQAKEQAQADLKAKEAEFAEAEAKRRTAELTARVDQLVADGKLLPASKPQVLAFCEAMQPGEEISFSEGDGKRPLVDHFLGFLAEAPTNGLTHEFSAPAGGGEDAPSEDLTQYV
jgi:type I restriction-modification system DNA methylase subunit